jgi:hypothetical protein
MTPQVTQAPEVQGVEGPRPGRNKGRDRQYPVIARVVGNEWSLFL